MRAKVIDARGYRTTREYKQTKRAQIEDLERAVRNLWRSGAWLPDKALRTLSVVREHVNDMKEATSLAEWGR